MNSLLLFNVQNERLLYLRLFQTGICTRSRGNLLKKCIALGLSLGSSSVCLRCTPGNCIMATSPRRLFYRCSESTG